MYTVIFRGWLFVCTHARTCRAAGFPGPQNTIVMRVALVLLRALARPGSFSLATNTATASEWLMMYSIAFSPSVSYRGTQW